MARDDYFVIVYKVLTYLYACKKRKIVFDNLTFKTAVGGDRINKEYLTDVLRMMTDEGLIAGLAFHNPWQNSWIQINDTSNAEITAKGIEYLTENSRMAEVKKLLLESVDFIASLIKLIG